MTSAILIAAIFTGGIFFLIFDTFNLAQLFKKSPAAAKAPIYERRNMFYESKKKLKRSR